MFHLLYKITNLLNGKYYYGIHSTNNLNDSYMGSSKDLQNDIKTFGIENFLKEEIEFLESRDLLFEKEKDIINEKIINDPLCYNKTIGGRVGKIGYANFITKDGKIVHLPINDPLVIKKEVVGQTIGISAKQKGIKIKKAVYILNDKKIYLSTNDPRVLNGEAIGMNKGIATYILNGKKTQLKTNDPRVLNGEAISLSKGRQSTKGRKTGKSAWNSINFSDCEKWYIFLLKNSGIKMNDIKDIFNKKFNKKIKSNSTFYNLIKLNS